MVLVTMARLCEYPRGDAAGKCRHVGFSTCQLHKQPVPENGEGWRTCCDECVTPYYVNTRCSSRRLEEN